MAASLNTELTFHELVLVVWRKKSTVFRCDMATIAPALFQFLDSDMDGRLSVGEILAASGERALLQFIDHTNCPVLKRLFAEKEAAVLRAFRRIDRDRSGDIGEGEWMAFLRQMQSDRLHFYRQRFLLKAHVYAGLGLEPGEPASAFAYKTLKLPRGFWEDLVYYARNNHPLLLLLYADAAHPFSVGSRRAELCGAVLTSFAGAGYLLTVSGGFWRRATFSAVAVTLPVAVFRKLAYLLFAAPCTVHDRSKVRSGCLATGLSTARAALKVAGYGLTLAWGAVFVHVGLGYWRASDGGARDYLTWALSVAEYWVLWFAVVLAFDFNPSPTSGASALGRLLNALVAKVGCGVIPTRVGRWHAERAKVLGIIRAQVELRGPRRFFLPQQHDAAVEGSRGFSVTLVAAPSGGVPSAGAVLQADASTGEAATTAAPGLDLGLVGRATNLDLEDGDGGGSRGVAL